MRALTRASRLPRTAQAAAPPRLLRPRGGGIRPLGSALGLPLGLSLRFLLEFLLGPRLGLRLRLLFRPRLGPRLRLALGLRLRLALRFLLRFLFPPPLGLRLRLALRFLFPPRFGLRLRLALGFLLRFLFPPRLGPRRCAVLRLGPARRLGLGLGLGLGLAMLAAGPACRRDDAGSAAAPAATGSATAPSATGSAAAPGAAGSATAPSATGGSSAQAATDSAPTAGPAPRLVSLTPSATEVVAALGATALLVGVDDYSSFPPEVTRLPRVGSFLAPNLETIVGLRPTLVIVDDVHGQVAGALNDAGVATVACAIHGLPDIKAALRSVGARIGRAADADRVIEAIEAALDRAAAHRPARRPRVLAVIDREAGGLGNLVTAGPGSWIDELLAVVGGDNVLSAAGVRYPKISAEEVLRARPEVILDLSFAARDSIAAWDHLAIPAVASHRVRALTDPFLAAPSPRVAEALAALARALD